MKSIKRDREISPAEFLNYTIIIVGMLVVAVVLILLVRVQRGLLGIVLGAIAVALLVYWISELRKTVKKELSIPITKWSPDILHQGDEVVVVGVVPGPEKKVKTQFRNGILEIRGGQRFHEFLTLGKHLKMEETKYVNRVLQVRLRKGAVINEPKA